MLPRLIPDLQSGPYTTSGSWAWWNGMVSRHRPPVFQTGALLTELPFHGAARGNRTLVPSLARKNSTVEPWPRIIGAIERIRTSNLQFLKLASLPIGLRWHLAGMEGAAPSSSGLESEVLLLNYTPAENLI